MSRARVENPDAQGHAWALLVVDRDIDVLRLPIRAAHQPRARGHLEAQRNALAGGCLLAGGPAGIPDATFARGWQMTVRDSQIGTCRAVRRRCSMGR